VLGLVIVLYSLPFLIHHTGFFQSMVRPTIANSIAFKNMLSGILPFSVFPSLEKNFSSASFYLYTGFNN
jgi:hypothetical protein